MINDMGADDSTYVEICGPAGASLAGYLLVGVNGYNGAEYATVELSGSIPPDGFYVVGESDSVANVDLVDELVDYQNGPDNIILKQGALIIDAIGYGAFTVPDTFFAGEGSPCAAPSQGASLCRYPDGYDTNINADDFDLSPNLTPGTANITPGGIPFYTLYELHANPPPTDQIFWTSGIATVNAELFSGPANINAYMQDDQAGVNVLGGSFAFFSGDCLWVKSRWFDFNGLLALYYPLEIDVGAHVGEPDAQEINCEMANVSGEALESMLVYLPNVWITDASEEWPEAGYNANLIISDSTGATAVLRLDKETDLDGWNDHPEEGEEFNLRGLLSQYGDYQILPRGQSDINPVLGVAANKTAQMPSDFRLDVPHPNPFNATATVRFALAAPGEFELSVFTILGARVATLSKGFCTAGEHQFIWRARELPSGIYLLRLQYSGGSQYQKALLLQ